MKVWMVEHNNEDMYEPPTFVGIASTEEKGHEMYQKWVDGFNPKNYSAPYVEHLKEEMMRKKMVRAINVDSMEYAEKSR